MVTKEETLGEGWLGGWGVAKTHDYVQNPSVTRTYYLAWENLFNTL